MNREDSSSAASSDRSLPDHLSTATPPTNPNEPLADDLPHHLFPSLYQSDNLQPPRRPHIWRHRGFGQAVIGRRCYSDVPLPFLMFHFAWPFLSPSLRLMLATSFGVMKLYARLRRRAVIRNIDYLRHPRPPPDDSPVDQHRALDMGCALLRFNFIYGDMIRWLGGPYTDDHRDWSSVFDQLNMVADQPPPPGYPPIDYDRVFRVCTEGTPLRGNFQADYASASRRNSQPHPDSLLKCAADVDAKIQKEEKLSYHLVLPRFLWRFLPGLFLCLFRVAYRWGDPKARLCVDPSTPLHKDDKGNPNRFIPDPGVEPDENPPIFYGTALLRYLQWLWNLRISYPFEDILQMADDISAAFHRVLYHPDMAIIFSCVWRDMLVVPVGSIFGARSGPSFYMQKGEMRSHFVQHFPNPDDLPHTDLAAQIVLPDDPSPDERAAFAQAVPDSRHHGIKRAQSDNPERRQPVFVDDSANAHIKRFIRMVINCSVAAAYILFGFPDDDPNRPPCINPKKWEKHVSHLLLFLGYQICTRTMKVIWPIAKREKLAIFLDAILDKQLAHPKPIPCTPHECSRFLGLIRHAAVCSPQGIYRSLRFQHIFNDAIKRAPQRFMLRRWYQRNRIHLPKHVINELKRIRASISSDLMDPLWCRPIGLIIPRDPTITFYTDASTVGLGGWSSASELNFMWRLRTTEFTAFGASQTTGHNNPQYQEVDLDPQGHHINILEFVAIIIQLWIGIRQIFRQAMDSTSVIALIPPGGHRILCLADNSSAVSWLRYASRTKRPNVRRLARLLQGFLAHPLCAEFLQVQGKHLPGIDNIGADILSRFKKWKSWDSVMEAHIPLKTLPICQLPPELLSTIALLLTSEQTEAWYEQRMTELWTIAPPSFVIGSSRTATTPHVLSPS